MQRDHLAATQAAGGQQIAEHGCGPSSVPGGIRLPEGRARGETCAQLGLAAGSAGVRPLFSRLLRPWSAFLGPGEDPSGQ